MIMKNSGEGEIVQVQGGHILRSIGRKDRHSKVITAKGPRDRRVRLSAHTAIRFYDVQDRLGYDRPSKAVDWLMKNAKNAIDKLSELPPKNPDEVLTENRSESSSGYGLDPLGENPEGSCSFIPSQSIADTMKSFPSKKNFQDCPNQTGHLRLSLPSSQGHIPTTDQTIFPDPATFGTNYQREGYILSSQSMPLHLQPFLLQSSVISQRGPFQPSSLPPVNAWDNQAPGAIQEYWFNNGQNGHFQFQVKPQIHSQVAPSAPPNSHH
ncbi:hypothetical protein NMG60_11019255 [Bertholletia excelsa]